MLFKQINFKIYITYANKYLFIKTKNKHMRECTDKVLEYSIKRLEYIGKNLQNNTN